MQFSMYNRVSGSYEVTHSRFNALSIESKITEDNLLIQDSFYN